MTGLSQEIRDVLSLTPTEPGPSTATPERPSARVADRIARAEAKRKAREETTTPVARKRQKKTRTNTAVRETTGRRTKFVIKTKLESMLRDEFNADQKRAFVNKVQRIVRHVSDVTYATSLFLNWYCLRRLRKRC